MRYSILQGDVFEKLREIETESVQCVVTSPPYWGLRDYKCDGQIGLEKTPQDYVAKMVAVFAEVRRVLRKDGTVWLNLRDSYAGGGCGCDTPKQQTNRGTNGMPKSIVPDGLKPKDLIGIPWRVALALQADGWYLRSDIIWAKPNTIPESVKDRPTRSHEYIFLLSKSAKYFYDADAIKEPASMRTDERPFGNAGGNRHGDEGRRYNHNSIEARKARASANLKSHPTAEHNGIRPASDKQRGHSRKHAGFNDRWDAIPKEEQCAGYRNKRDVWTVPPAQFRDAHFATFPPKLIEPCILAGSKPGDVVLDPFYGSGTTLEVSIQHGRIGLGIEINPDYIKIAHRRLENALPLLAVGGDV